MYKHYKNGYYVSDKGKVKRIRNDIIVKENFIVSKTDYQYIIMYNQNSTKFFIHRAVAELFIEKTKGKWIVDHINRNKCDNRALNLRWVTHKENMNNKS